MHAIKTKVSRYSASDPAAVDVLFCRNPVPLLIYDPTSLSILASNAAFQEAYGYSHDELLGMSVENLRPPEDVDKFRALIAAGTQPVRRSGTWRHCRRDGTIMFVQVESTPISYHDQPARLVASINVDDKLRVERLINRDEERLNSLLDLCDRTSTMTEQEAMELAAAEAMARTDSQLAYLHLVGGSQSSIELAAACASQENSGRLLAAAEMGLIADRAQECVVAQVPVMDNNAPTETGRRNRLAVPIVENGHAVMVIEVLGKRGDYEEGDVRQLRLLGGAVWKALLRKRGEREIGRMVEQLEQAVLGTVTVIRRMGELRDPYTAGHERRVGALAAAVGEEMGLDPDQVKGLRIIGYLHDIGKIGAPVEILAKPTRLSKAEMALVQQHSRLGYEILKNVPFPWPVADAVLQHHERIDGSGYPDGIGGDKMLLESRIVAVCDVVEAMIAHRPYRRGLGVPAALKEIETGAGRWYDAEVVATCLRLFREKNYRI